VGVRQVEDYRRKFLVVVDDKPECGRAATFAAYRVRRTGGTVVFLAVIDTADFQQFLGGEEVMRADAVEAAERLLATHAARARAIGDIAVETAIREGRPADAVEQLVRDDPGIAILVLASNASGDGPGELVTAFANRTNALNIPLTIVPGSMTDAEIEAVC